MKKGIKRLFISLLVIVFIATPTAVVPAHAANETSLQKLPTYVAAMNTADRAEWVEAHLQPVKVTVVMPTRTGTTIYTNTKTTYTGPQYPDGELIYHVGKLQTRVTFDINSAGTAIEDWDTYTFSATKTNYASGTGTINTDFSYNEISSSNVKLMYFAGFVRVDGEYCAEHHYNIYGNGGYSVVEYVYVI